MDEQDHMIFLRDLIKKAAVAGGCCGEPLCVPLVCERRPDNEPHQESRGT